MNAGRAAKPGIQGSRLRSLARISVLAVATALIAGVLPAPATSAAEKSLVPIGFLDRPSTTTYGANGNILVDHAHSRAYQASIVDEAAITELDLATLKPVTTFTMPRIHPVLTDKGPTDWVWSLDSKNRRLFAFRAEKPSEDNGIPTFALMNVDLVTKKQSPPRNIWPLGDRIPLAMYYDPPSDRIYVLSQLKVELLNRSRYYLEERTTSGELIWEQRQDQCYAARDNQYGPALWRSMLNRRHVYFNCYNATTVQAQVVRVTLSGSGVASTESFPAVPGSLSTMFDLGSDRMFFLTTNSGAGRGAWVFDGRRSAFLGIIASGDNRVGASDYAMGIDPVHGRLYMQTPAGLLVADARRTPLPAGLLFRAYAGPGVGLIQVDPARRRIFVPDPRSLSDVGRATRYAVFRDDIAVSLDPRPGDPDQLTIDVEERAGKTGSSFSGSARGYGVRVIQTGGLHKTAWNLAAGQFPNDDPSSPLLFGAWTQLAATPVSGTNREVVSAQVKSVTLTSDSADVVTRAIHVDGGTERDLTERGASWPFPDVECHDGGEKRDAANGAAGTTAATCDVGNRLAFGSAGSSQVPLKDVTVGSSFTVSSVTRAPRGGLVARTVAVAKDIEILGRVRIGTLRTEAEASARGRRGGAAGRFERYFSDVQIDANADGSPEYSCASACEPRTVATLINNALAGIAAVEFPQPDPLYYPRGSAGGYQAIVEKERFRSYSEKSLNDDETAEIPGMQIVAFNDGRAGRTRHVVQLAGVQAEAHYGIYLLPDGGPAVTGPDCAAQPGECVPPAQPRPPVVTADPPQAPPADQPSIPKVRTVLDRIVKRLPSGAAVALARPADAAMLGALWAFLALPGYLMWRRRFVGVRRTG